MNNKPKRKITKNKMNKKVLKATFLMSFLGINLCFNAETKADTCPAYRQNKYTNSSVKVKPQEHLISIDNQVVKPTTSIIDLFSGYTIFPLGLEQNAALAAALEVSSNICIESEGNSVSFLALPENFYQKIKNNIFEDSSDVYPHSTSITSGNNLIANEDQEDCDHSVYPLSYICTIKSLPTADRSLLPSDVNLADGKGLDFPFDKQNICIPILEEEVLETFVVVKWLAYLGNAVKPAKDYASTFKSVNNLYSIIPKDHTLILSFDIVKNIAPFISSLWKNDIKKWNVEKDLYEMNLDLKTEYEKDTIEQDFDKIRALKRDIFQASKYLEKLKKTPLIKDYKSGAKLIKGAKKAQSQFRNLILKMPHSEEMIVSFTNRLGGFVRPITQVITPRAEEYYKSILDLTPGVLSDVAPANLGDAVKTITKGDRWLNIIMIPVQFNMLCSAATDAYNAVDNKLQVYVNVAFTTAGSGLLVASLYDPLNRDLKVYRDKYKVAVFVVNNMIDTISDTLDNVYNMLLGDNVDGDVPVIVSEDIQEISDIKTENTVIEEDMEVGASYDDVCANPSISGYLFLLETE